MLLSRIFFNGLRALLGVAALAGQTAASATVSGTVRVVSPATHAHAPSEIAVWLEPESGSPPAGPAGHVRLLQKGKTFQPHLLIVRTGAIVDFPNQDPIFHNAFSTFNGQIFDIGLYPPGTNRAVKFHRPGVVRVFCNIHPSMSAVIIVVDSPYFTTASPDGSYRLTNVSPGQYRLNIYDERATGKQDDGAPLLVSGDEASVTVPTVSISEAGYVKLPHKNKFGRDYAPGSDNPSYDGIMR